MVATADAETSLTAQILPLLSANVTDIRLRSVVTQALEHGANHALRFLARRGCTLTGPHT